MVRGSPCMCISTTAAFDAASASSAPSARRAITSLTMPAPAARAARITPGLEVSTLIGSEVFARADTPLHSLLHEACHLIVLPPERRAAVHTDATDSVPEEDATCYLQLRLADYLPGFGFARACADMDAWGYSFRLGSARAWFERDAEDARAFLERAGLLAADGTIPLMAHLPKAAPDPTLER